MVDPAPYLLALVTALIGAAAGYVGNALKTQAGARTAARLVHAELLQNAASIIFYRNTGRLLAPTVRRTAWDANSEALARLKKSEAFTAISGSYVALEGIAYLAKAGEEVPEEKRDLLEQAIERLKRGVETCGQQARLGQHTIDAEVLALGRHDGGTRTIPEGDAGLAPLPELAIAAIVGSPLQRVAAIAVTTGTGIFTAATELPRVRHAWPDRALRGQPRRLILDARQDTDVSAAVVVRREGDPDTGDAAVDEAYDALGVTYDFFRSVYGLDSYDGEGAELRGVVHFGRQFQNGFWDGRQLVYGDGDERIFRRFTYGLDMTAHEFAMAAVGHVLRLVFANQSGALLTSIGDVFGVLVKQYRQQQTAEEANWLLGDTLLVPRPGIRALRSLKDPGSAYHDDLLGRDPQLAHMRDYVPGDNEVHIISGIPNRAFYLVAMELGGPAWETAGRIWWASVQDRKLTQNSGFRAFANATVRAADDHADVVIDAWRQVGVRTSVPAPKS